MNELARIEPEQPTEAEQLVTVIARAAADPNVNVEKMERLYAMLKEEKARIAEQKYNEAMRQAQADMPTIVKDAKNQSTNSTYARLETLKKLATPIITSNGFSQQFSQADGAPNGKIRVQCKVSHSAGHSETFHLDLTPDDVGAKGNPNKTKIHGEGSTFSYGERYLTKLIFNITIAGEDDDGNHGNKPKPQGPSKVDPPDPALKALALELWQTLKTVRGEKKDWKEANDWLWREEILDGAIPECAPDLSAAKFREAIEKAKAKLA